MRTLYYVTSRMVLAVNPRRRGSSESQPARPFTQKRQAIRVANRKVRALLGAKLAKRDRQVSVRIGKPTGKLLYQCHARHEGASIRIVREEL